MAVTPVNPEIKFLGITVYRPEEDGSRKMGARYVWWDAGVPTIQWVEVTAIPGAQAEDTVNAIIDHANEAWDVAHEV